MICTFCGLTKRHFFGIMYRFYGNFCVIKICTFVMSAYAVELPYLNGSEQPF